MTDMLDLNHIQLADRPLIVCDIDEVVLEFLTPFSNFLRSCGRDLLPRSFRLNGNIVEIDTGPSRRGCDDQRAAGDILHTAGPVADAGRLRGRYAGRAFQGTRISYS